jgi:hypothetical protein
MRVFKFLILSLTVTLAGCSASGPKYKEMAMSVPVLKEDQSRIYFFRAKNHFGAAIQPNIKLDGLVVGQSIPGGFFFVDTSAGEHEVSITTEVEHKLRLTLDRGEVKYVETPATLGALVAHITPRLAIPEVAQPKIIKLSYTGDGASQK